MSAGQNAEPIRIDSVRVRNFRCFSDFEGTFSKLTSLVGENATGKTSLIEAIYYCLAPYTGTSRFCEQDFNREEAGAIEIQVKFNRSFEAKVPDGYSTQSVVCDGVRLAVKRRERAGAGRALNDPYTLEHHVIPSEVQYGPGPNWQLRRASGTDFKFTARNLALANIELDGYPTVQYFGKTRERQATGGYGSTFERLLDELSWRFRKGISGRETEMVEAWEAFNALALGAVDEGKREALLGRFTDLAAELIGNDCTDVELSLLRLEEPFAKAFVARRSGVKQVDLGGMGSGVSMLLALALLETISQLDDSGLVILIDEPEMHLHPQLQTRLRQHLASLPHQVIYTTHSPLMVDIGDWNTIRRLDASGRMHPIDATLGAEIPQNGQPKTLADHLDEIGQYRQHVATFVRENNELLFARGTVLVEGPVDKYAIEVLSETAGCDLSQLTVIACHGKTKIPYYQLLCRAFAVPYFTVFDRDADDDPNNESVRRLATDGYVFEFNPSFEAELGVAQGRHEGTRAIQAVDELVDNGGRIPEAISRLLEILMRFQQAVLDEMRASTNPGCKAEGQESDGEF